MAPGAACHLFWTSPARRCGVLPLGSAVVKGRVVGWCGRRRWKIGAILIDMLTTNDVTAFADKAHQGAGGTVRTPVKRHATRPHLSRGQKAAEGGQKAVNRAHARVRALGERAVSLLMGWKVLAQLPLLPAPGRRGQRGHSRPAPHRDRPPTTMKRGSFHGDSAGLEDVLGAGGGHHGLVAAVDHAEVG